MSSCWGASLKSATSRRIRSATAWAGRCAACASSSANALLAEHRGAVAALEHAVGDGDEQVTAAEHVALGDVGDVRRRPRAGSGACRSRGTPPSWSTRNGGGWPALTRSSRTWPPSRRSVPQTRVRKRARAPSSRIAAFSRSSVAASGKPGARQGLDRVPGQAGHRRGLGAGAADVADDEAPRALPDREQVVEVPAGRRVLPRGLVDHADVEARAPSARTGAAGSSGAPGRRPGGRRAPGRCRSPAPPVARWTRRPGRTRCAAAPRAGRPMVRWPIRRPARHQRDAGGRRSPRTIRCRPPPGGRARRPRGRPQVLDLRLVLVPDLLEHGLAALVGRGGWRTTGDARDHDLAGDRHRHVLVERPGEQVPGVGDVAQPAAALALGRPGAGPGRRPARSSPRTAGAAADSSSLNPSTTARRPPARRPPSPRRPAARPPASAGPVPASSGTSTLREVGHHDRAGAGCAGRACPGAPGASRVPSSSSGRPLTATTSNSSSKSWESSTYVASADDRVPDPLGGQREVLVDAEPDQRVVAQPEGRGLGVDDAGRGSRVLEERPLLLRDDERDGPLSRVGRAACARRTPVAVAPLLQAHGVGALPPAGRPARSRSSGGRRRAAGSSRSTYGRPVTSSAVQPNRAVASSFQPVTSPASEISTTATRAPSRGARCVDRAPCAGAAAPSPARTPPTPAWPSAVYSTPHAEARDVVITSPRPCSERRPAAGRSRSGSARPGCWSSTSMRRLVARAGPGRAGRACRYGPPRS